MLYMLAYTTQNMGHFVLGVLVSDIHIIISALLWSLGFSMSLCIWLDLTVFSRLLVKLNIRTLHNNVLLMYIQTYEYSRVMGSVCVYRPYISTSFQFVKCSLRDNLFLWDLSYLYFKRIEVLWPVFLNHFWPLSSLMGQNWSSCFYAVYNYRCGRCWV